ncbi:beta-amyrin 11-oxidase-like [Tripterygium wilfordii]|uniref:beta-amyrin 11-oxidase-like n=1 Tax=Tripterygium wilfordii TaxID=458696 RepID=UPI0018F83533|nr:beta-amyrin 11-oxidase-like [Tripterygium wilfordii]
MELFNDKLDLFLTVAVSVYVCGLVYWLMKNANELYYCLGKKNLPPGDMGWPLIGNTLSFSRAFKSANPESFLENLVSRYGRTGVYKTHLLGKPLIMVNHPELNKAILTDDKNFALAYPGLTEILGKRSLATIHGDEHKRLRRLTTAPINGNVALSMYVEHIEHVVMASFDEWASMNKPIELLVELKSATFKVVTYIFFGARGYSILAPLTEVFRDLSGGIFTRPINLPGFAYNKALKARRRMVEIVNAAIEERKIENKSGVDFSKEKKSMLDLLLEMEDEDGEKMDNITIIDLLGSLVFGGHETTAIAIMWLLIYLHDNPQILRKVKEEQEHIISNRPSTQKGLTMAEIKQMSYTSKVFQETLRITNIGVGGFRDAKADVEINGYTIPKGWKVLLMFRDVHLNPEIFPNPKAFDASRWDNTNIKAGAFIPFGLGSRICPGNELAKLEALIFIHYFLLDYKLERINPNNEIVSFPVRLPKDNLLVKFTKVSSS